MKKELMWGMLVHLGTNMLYEEGNEHGGCAATYKCPASPVLRFDRKIWNEHIDALRAAGCNTLVIDIGEGMRYTSHPELAVEGSFTHEQMREELDRLRALGFKYIIPKLNFSTAHDTWLGEYGRMVSSSIYYSVCRDIIDEVCEVFKPEYFHLGMDEENSLMQRDYDYAVVRRHDLWWHDLKFLVSCVERNGARAMMWADHAREHLEEVIEKCPRSVVQCVWYYGVDFIEPLEEFSAIRVRPFAGLDKAGFDIFSCGSISSYAGNFERLTPYCRDVVSEEHLLGYMQTVWEAAIPKYKDALDLGVQTFIKGRENYDKPESFETMFPLNASEK